MGNLIAQNLRDLDSKIALFKVLTILCKICNMQTFFGDTLGVYIFSFLGIAIVTMCIKALIAYDNLAIESGRKILHFFAITTCAYVIYRSDHNLELAALFALFSLVLFVIAHQNVLLPNDRKSYGIALFPLAFSALLLTPISKEAILFGVLTLGISDALAGWIGQRFGKRPILFLYEPKTWVGFSVFFAATCCIAIGIMGLHPYLFILALLPALSELFSYRGSDNLTIPILAAVWFERLVDRPPNDQDYLIFVVMLLLCFVVFSKKWLSEAGTAAALLVGIVILFMAGSKYLLAIALFFVAGSLASKLHPKNKDASGRTALQVFSNGGIAAVCALLFAFSQREVWLLAYFMSINISLADTISSDLGTYFKQKTYDILSMKRTVVGLSGGISFAGTFSGTIAATLFAWFCQQWYDLSLTQLVVIAVGGTMGMFVDSLLGSWLQGKYTIKNEVIDSYTDGATLVHGKGWFDNNMANLWCNIIVILSFLIFQYC